MQKTDLLLQHFMPVSCPSPAIVYAWYCFPCSSQIHSLIYGCRLALSIYKEAIHGLLLVYLYTNISLKADRYYSLWSQDFYMLSVPSVRQKSVLVFFLLREEQPTECLKTEENIIPESSHLFWKTWSWKACCVVAFRYMVLILLTHVGFYWLNKDKIKFK